MKDKPIQYLGVLIEVAIVSPIEESNFQELLETYRTEGDAHIKKAEIRTFKDGENIGHDIQDFYDALLMEGKALNPWPDVDHNRKDGGRYE